MNSVFFVKDYVKNGASDSEAVAAALAAARECDARTVVFDGRDYVIDEAVVLPSNTHVIIDNCTVSQRDRVFDNIFRGENLIVNPDEPYGYPLRVDEIFNIKIEGRGNARLVGTAQPRIGYHPGRDEYQEMTGDFWGWRTMMICFALGENIEICGLELSKTMCWAVTFEWCSDVYVHDLAIYSNVKNGDGIDFRSGCHHCRVENISGYTTDDTVACTALSENKRGDYPNKKSVYPMSSAAGMASGRSCDIHDIEIKGIKTGGLCHAIICLAAKGNQVYNISISDVDEAPIGSRKSTVSIYTGYAEGYKPGDIHHVHIDGVHATQSEYAVELRADARDVSVKNVVQDNPCGNQVQIFPLSQKKTGFRIGMSTSSAPISTLDSQFFNERRNAGVRDIEISAPDDTAAQLDFKELSRLSYEYGVKLNSLHLPFQPFERIDISKPELAEYTVSFLSDLIRRASGEAKIKLFVIHPSGEPISDCEREIRMSCAKESLKRLAAVARECGAIIAVENLPRTCLGRSSKEILELVSADSSLRVCFDTNHLLSESHRDFVSAVGHLIAATHISDYDFNDERHLLPGEGLVNWQEVAMLLTGAAYRGVWTYELSCGSRTRVERPVPLSPSDFVRNANEIFEGREITKHEHTLLF